MRINALIPARLFLAVPFLAAFLGGCSERPSTQPADAPPDAIAPDPGDATEAGGIDACALLSAEEIRSVHGQGHMKTLAARKSEGGLTVSQCLFELPVRTDSIGLRVVEKASGPNGRDPKTVWQETFHKNVQDTDRSKKARLLQKVDGAGDEAFWLGNVKMGGLYVLKGHRYIKITVGGEDDLETKIKKASALAQLILPRL